MLLFLLQPTIKPKQNPNLKAHSKPSNKLIFDLTLSKYNSNKYLSIYNQNFQNRKTQIKLFSVIN